MEDPIQENSNKNKKRSISLENKNTKEKNKIITQEEFEYAHKQWKYKTIAWIVMFITVTIILTSSITYYITVGKKYNNLYNSISNLSESETTNASETISDISKILNSFASVIDEKYVGDINKQEIVNSTIKGFVEGIGDKYSEYMTAEEWEDYQASALGNYCGVGIYMAQDDSDNVVVASTIKGTPAEEAGIKSGDIITAINGISTTDMTLDEVSNSVKGEEGTDVTITIYRDGESKDFTMKRSSIKIYHVESKMLDETTGYISLLTFDEGCSEEFETKMDELVNQGATKIILDLRYNTGGIVDEALKIIDLFVDNGATELIEKDSQGNEKITTSKTDKKYNVKLAILINKYTASSSEIVTGALVDNGLATTVGTLTYGKGVIQNVYSLSTGGVLKLTTAEYYTPSRSKINGVGITPDYEIELDTTNSDSEDFVDNQLQKAQEILNQ